MLANQQAKERNFRKEDLRKSTFIRKPTKVPDQRRQIRNAAIRHPILTLRLSLRYLIQLAERSTTKTIFHFTHSRSKQRATQTSFYSCVIPLVTAF